MEIKILILEITSLHMEQHIASGNHHINSLICNEVSSIRAKKSIIVTIFCILLTTSTVASMSNMSHRVNGPLEVPLPCSKHRTLSILEYLVSQMDKSFVMEQAAQLPFAVSYLYGDFQVRK